MNDARIRLFVNWYARLASHGKTNSWYPVSRLHTPASGYHSAPVAPCIRAVLIMYREQCAEEQNQQIPLQKRSGNRTVFCWRIVNSRKRCSPRARVLHRLPLRYFVILCMDKKKKRTLVAISISVSVSVSISAITSRSYQSARQLARSSPFSKCNYKTNDILAVQFC